MTAFAAAERATVGVELGARRYDIRIGAGALDELAERAAPLKLRRLFVVTDANVARLHGERLRHALKTPGPALSEIVLPAGEGSKDFATLQTLCDRLLALRPERGDTILAFGGGVIGDLAGFAAAILLRGIDFIQVPTTLLAQVDSSVGGKTGINTAAGKNLVGAFHQPRLVVADTALIDTLPRRERLAGYAEIAKYGLLGDAAFFAWLEANGAAVVDRAGAERTGAVRRSCAMKAEIVAADEREAGRRALLNLGHTFGHALEAEAGYGETLLHGEGVALGCVMALELSARLGLCAADQAERLRRHWRALGLPVSLTDGALAARAWPAERLIGHMAGDKKAQGGRIAFILARGIGRAFVSRDVPMEAVRATLEAAGAS